LNAERRTKGREKQREVSGFTLQAWIVILVPFLFWSREMEAFKLQLLTCNTTKLLRGKTRGNGKTRRKKMIDWGTS
jgi:hypothetical protein